MRGIIKKNEMVSKQEKSEQDILDVKMYCGSCGSVMLDSSLRYRDKWGEVWYRESLHYIRRLSDGNVGCWFEGKDLELITN